MSEFNRESVYSASDGFQRYMTKVFSTMGTGNPAPGGRAYGPHKLFHHGNYCNQVSEASGLGIPDRQHFFPPPG